MYANFKDCVILVSCLPGLGKSELAANNLNVIDYEIWIESQGSIECNRYKNRNILNDLNAIIDENSNVHKDSCLFILSSTSWDFFCHPYIRTNVYVHMNTCDYTLEELSRRDFSSDVSSSHAIGVEMNTDFINRKRVVKNRHYTLQQHEDIRLSTLLVYCDEHNVYTIAQIKELYNKSLLPPYVKTHEGYHYGN